MIDLRPDPWATAADPPLQHTLDVFGRWLHLDDPAPVLAVAATIVGNLAPGDPLWLFLVGPPSGGKTEIINSLTRLPYIVSAATITEASLLSGSPKRERTRDATGGLLRQVGDFGVLLAKDFTSVLTQNRDTARTAMSAMREIYDGSWHRPVGTDGGRVLHWAGKCGFVGGVTPSYDRYGAIVNALGDRFVLLRLPDVDPLMQSMSALAHDDSEAAMRAELAGAMTALITAVDPGKVLRPLGDEERSRLISLATFTARARTAVERDGYDRELLVMPQAEGPARLVKAIRRLYGALEAIGVEETTRWEVLRRVAIDCVPAIRTPLIRALIAAEEMKRTSDIAEEVGLVTKTAHRHLEDLVLLGLAEQSKGGGGSFNSPDTWAATQWLREHWPKPKVGQRPTTNAREEEVIGPSAVSLGTSLSHLAACRVCREPIDPAAGDTHPGCEPRMW